MGFTPSICSPNKQNTATLDAQQIPDFPKVFFVRTVFLVELRANPGSKIDANIRHWRFNHQLSNCSTQVMGIKRCLRPQEKLTGLFFSGMINHPLSPENLGFFLPFPAILKESPAISEGNHWGPMGPLRFLRNSHKHPYPRPVPGDSLGLWHCNWPHPCRSSQGTCGISRVGVQLSNE